METGGSSHSNITAQPTSYAHLLIELRAGSICYLPLEHHHAGTQIKHGGEFTATRLQSVGDSFADKVAKSIVLSVFGRHPIIIPEALYNEHQLYEMYRFSSGDESEAHLLSAKIPSLGAYLVSAIDKNLYQDVVHAIPQVNIIDKSAVWLETLLRFNKYNDTTEAYLYLEEEVSYIAIVEDGKLKFFNAFHTANEIDLAYFLLYSCEQMEVNIRTAYFTLFGAIEPKHQAVLKKYVPNIRRDYPRLFTHDTNPEDLKQNTILYHQHLCV